MEVRVAWAMGRSGIVGLENGEGSVGVGDNCPSHKVQTETGFVHGGAGEAPHHSEKNIENDRGRVQTLGITVHPVRESARTWGEWE